MSDPIYLYLCAMLLAVALLENLYLRHKIKKLTTKCGRWEDICAEHRAEIIKRAGEKAMEGVAEQNREEIKEYMEREGANETRPKQSSKTIH